MLNNIILMGYKAAGKTTIGQELAFAMGYQFLDLDQLFQQTQQIDIRTFVASHGMARFRVLEHDLIRGLQPMHSYVIACGGGVVESKSNILYLRHLGCLVFLDLAYEVILLRLSHMGNRPDFVNEAHYHRRRKLYVEAAQYIFPLSGQDLEQEVASLYQFLQGKIDGI